jgi:hypothetical protein
VIIHYKFDPGVDAANQDRIKAALAKAFQEGEIMSCKCPTLEAWVYETLPPDFQASISCSCDVIPSLTPIFRKSFCLNGFRHFV